MKSVKKLVVCEKKNGHIDDPSGHNAEPHKVVCPSLPVCFLRTYWLWWPAFNLDLFILETMQFVQSSTPPIVSLNTIFELQVD